jgi:hypothetical protein
VNEKVLLMGVAVLVLYLANKRRVIESAEVRGIRNNNAGNIRAAAIIWDGQTGIDNAGFAIFKSSEWGIRALGKLLLNYERLHGLNTVAGIIGRYAPTNENDTDSYINSVSKKIGLDPYTSFVIADYLPALVNAIIKHENGINPYSDELINNGLALIGEYQYV